MSTVSLKQSTPLPLKYPSTPSGISCRRGFATCRFVGALSSTESVISVTRTRPAVLIDSIRAGARSYATLRLVLEECVPGMIDLPEDESCKLSP